MLIQSCALALLMVILMRSAKELAWDARFWFMMICMPFNGMAVVMLKTNMASMSTFPHTWKSISLMRLFFASASLSMLPGSWRVITFPVGNSNRCWAEELLERKCGSRIV